MTKDIPTGDQLFSIIMGKNKHDPYGLPDQPDTKAVIEKLRQQNEALQAELDRLKGTGKPE